MSLNDKKVLNKNRRNLDIVREVLSIASVKARKTRIMYGANLSFVQVEKYLKLLLGSGLLEHDISGYAITETGTEFLDLYNDYLKRSAHLAEEVEKNTRDRLQLEKMCFTKACKMKSEKRISNDFKNFEVLK